MHLLCLVVLVLQELFVGGDMSVAGTLTYEDVTNTETAGVTTTGGLVVTGLGATFGSGVGIADSIYHIGDDNTAIRFPVADTFTVRLLVMKRIHLLQVLQLVLEIIIQHWRNTCSCEIWIYLPLELTVLVHMKHS